MDTDLLDYIDIFENVDIGIMVVDKNKIIKKINKQCLDICLLKQENVIEKPLNDLIRRGIFINIYQLLQNSGLDNEFNKVKLFAKNKIIKNYNLIMVYNLESLIFKPNTTMFYTKNDQNSINIIAFSKKMTSIVNFAIKIARTDATILIAGESGTGKDLLAKFIHYSSNRRDKPFIKINCASIPENLFETELFGYYTGAFSGAHPKGKKGLIEEANEGTLFLNEVAELPLSMQAKLLDVLQEKRLTKVGGTKPIDVDIRIIAATNRDLKKLIEQKKFREDLYYRLDVISIDIPPLRERKEDIEPLILYIQDFLNEKFGFNKSIMPDLIAYFKTLPWMGNVRELENQIEKLFFSTQQNALTKKDFILIFNVNENNNDLNNDLKALSFDFERETFIKALNNCKTTRQLAKYLGVSQTTVVRKLKKYNLKLK